MMGLGVRLSPPPMNRLAAETSPYLLQHAANPVDWYPWGEEAVDREERPDLDSIYMDAVVALTGSGGWPMTVFLTPAGEPFFGGTYFPPEPRHGLPSFQQLLAAVADAWRERRDDVGREGRSGGRATGRVRSGLGRLRRRAEVPACVGARVPAAARRG